METIRKLTEIDRQYLPIVERMFGRRLESMADTVLVLRKDRDEFRATLNSPVRLARFE